MDNQVSLCSDNYGLMLVDAALDYKQTLCTFPCSSFSWWMDRLDRPRDHEKPQHKSHRLYTMEILLTPNQKRGVNKKISPDSKQSLWVILKEHNLCDVDRTVPKWRCCAGVHQLTQLHQLSWGALIVVSVARLWKSRVDGCLDALMALMDLLQTPVK